MKATNLRRQVPKLRCVLVLLLASSLAIANETSKSYDGGNDHNGSNPLFAMPGAWSNLKAQVANATLSPNGPTIILATRSTGGDGTQTEDDLYVGVKGRQSGNVNKSAKAASVNKSAAVQTGQPAGVTIPDHGDWSAFVQIKGKDFLSVTRVRASRYLNYEKG